MSTHHHLSFEEKFKAFVPSEWRVSTWIEKEISHSDAWIIVKALAYALDIGISIFIIPIWYNIYHYLKWWQTLGQQRMWIRIYDYYNINTIANIPTLLHRFFIKSLFFLLWAVVWINIASLWFEPYLSYQSTYRIFHSIYIIFMLLWIHGYAFTMISNKHSRWLQDIRAGTIVAYDHHYSTKRIILWFIGCVVLYYVIFWLSPSILSFIDSHFHWEREQSYRAIRSWIDHWVLTGLSSIDVP